MVIDLGRSGPRRARVWLDEVPDGALFEPIGIARRESVRARPAVGSAVSACAVEILVTAGPHWHYALLGAIFAPDRTGWLQWMVGWCNPVPKELSWSFMAGCSFDRLAVGLSLEEAQWAADGLRAATAGDGLPPSGALCVGAAVTAHASSSPLILRGAADGLAAMFCEDRMALTSERIAELVDNGLRRAVEAGRRRDGPARTRTM